MKDLWSIADKLRAEGHKIDKYTFLKIAKENNLPLTLDDIKKVTSFKDEFLYTPDFVIDFISSYLIGKK